MRLAQPDARCHQRGKERLKTSPVLADLRWEVLGLPVQSLTRCALPTEGAAESASAHSAGTKETVVVLLVGGAVQPDFMDRWADVAVT